MSLLAALPILGGIASAFSMAQETGDQRRALEAEARAAFRNAAIAREAGAFNAARQQDEANQIFGTIRADVGASGTEQDSGNVFDILRQSHTNAEIERLSILHSAELEAQNLEAQGHGYLRQGQAIKKQLPLRQAGALLGAAGSAYQMSGGSSSKAAAPKYKPTSSSPKKQDYSFSQLEDSRVGGP